MQYENELQEILKSDTWEAVGEHLLTKMISEFMYEDIIFPTVVSEKENIIVYELKPNNKVIYQFEGKKRLMDSYHIFKDTIRRFENGNWEKGDNPIQFILDIQETVGMTSLTTGHLIKEYNNTLLADAHILEKKQSITSDDIVNMDYVELEGEMEGHPWITYNKGRIGFDYQDYLSYAPEQKKKVKLSWVAVHQDVATFQSIPDLNYKNLIKGELGKGKIEQFKGKLTKENLDSSNYFFLPIHDWQWTNVIIQYFSEDIAKRRIVPLGNGDDDYLPQQSIRTFANTTDKAKHHVKLPISILNTLVYRGLPGERTVVAPMITNYIHKIKKEDSFLHDECRVILPGEVASINYNHPYYEKLKGAPYQYLEMLGVIWRESIYSFLDEGEKAITLASLLYVDKDGKPFVSSLIEKSGLNVKEWLDQLFSVMLLPLLHYLYKYGIVFSPHGQNTVLVLKDNKPHRLAIKDFVDDVNVSDEPLPELDSLPKKLIPVLRSEPAEGLCQFIFTGLFVCHLRYLADILDVYYQYDEEAFWSQLRQSIVDYQERFPELEERFRIFDLLRPSFTKLCLNRNRMIDYGYSDDDDRPHASEFGKVHNPLYVVSCEHL
ncbi:IucA/IucC family siderophore biosynthesis protein [Gracilibacillus salitolerans]|uniref:IucA/IucC family siderophore biosynthesis protein n=1 Tax=Gracilibacillus salitolerans TaxID=2663022 RepID=A0A5Q2TGF1_9BACI|nr:IucA/IucC family siderophore biosynthesis protein [Gracilibacillus salitolerans]QGH33287.1 IucA/IucC family siderophore biosynthesis protein [Gracilibacillus salitolerans]